MSQWGGSRGKEKKENQPKFVDPALTRHAKINSAHLITSMCKICQNIFLRVGGLLSLILISAKIFLNGNYMIANRPHGERKKVTLLIQPSNFNDQKTLFHFWCQYQPTKNHTLCHAVKPVDFLLFFFYASLVQETKSQMEYLQIFVLPHLSILFPAVNKCAAVDVHSVWPPLCFCASVTRGWRCTVSLSALYSVLSLSSHTRLL